MQVIGELINSSRKKVAPLIEGRDAKAIQDLARKQKEAGAAFIDVNAGTFVDKEVEHLEWLVTTVQEAVEGPLCIDSPNPKALEKALTRHQGKALVNSITAENDRYQAIVPLIKKYKCSVVALCMDDTGMPETAEQRFEVAKKLVADLGREGIEQPDIYFDPLVRPISTDVKYGGIVLETISRIKTAFPDVHTTCGLSNVSFGLPLRKLMNQNFLVLAMGAGLDGVILDPLDTRIMSNLHAAEALLGGDDYCLNYIGKHREEKLGL